MMTRNGMMIHGGTPRNKIHEFSFGTKSCFVLIFGKESNVDDVRRWLDHNNTNIDLDIS